VQSGLVQHYGALVLTVAVFNINLAVIHIIFITFQEGAGITELNDYFFTKDYLYYY